ncbi:Protein of unknown function [Pyronema omphalodes CBS 100304]|uniref:Uncharacterized protein n=1 Tax=Pyronema omphalodes (strain CBS 100304) TaxID=1076935 RepID=U4LLB7_PYROM|nr:Protein of unknown function [Pyronema omphalodes CBS 100304]
MAPVRPPRDLARPGKAQQGPAKVPGEPVDERKQQALPTNPKKISANETNKLPSLKAAPKNADGRLRKGWMRGPRTFAGHLRTTLTSQAPRAQ